MAHSVHHTLSIHFACLFKFLLYMQDSVPLKYLDGPLCQWNSLRLNDQSDSVVCLFIDFGDIILVTFVYSTDLSLYFCHCDVIDTLVL